MTKKMYTLPIEANVHILVNESAPPDLFSRGQDAAWAASMYGPMTERQILEHWAFNAVVNGILHVSSLDGWADVARDAVDIEVVP